MARARKTTRPEEPLGPRDLDFDALDDDDFELLCSLIVLLEHPTVVHLANPDGGADTALPATSGAGYERVWQAKRFTKNFYVAKCVESLDAAVKNYAMSHYTFQFARNLTRGQEANFETRLRHRHPGVTVDYCGKTNLLSRLLASPQGQRIADNFYGDPTTDAKSLALALRAGGGAIESAPEALERLGAIADWLDRYDPFFDYPTSSRGRNVPAPLLWPGSIGAIELSNGERVQRIEAVPRNTEALRLFTPMGHLEFDSSPEGQRALAAFNEALAHGGTVEIEKGSRVKFSRVPPAFRPFLSEEGIDKIVIRAGRPMPKPWPATLHARSDRGDASIDADLAPVPAPAGWEAALEAVAGGLTLTALLRRTERGGQIHLNWTYDPTQPDDLRHQARTLDVLDVLHGGGQLVISDRSGQRPDLPLTTTPRPVPEYLPPNRKAIGWLIEISDWLERDLNLPADGFTLEEFRLLAEVAHIVRTQESRMNFEQVTLQFPREEWEKHRPTLESGAQLHVEVPVALPQFEAQIGTLVGDLSGVRIATRRAVETESGPEIEVRLEPANDESRHLIFRLTKRSISRS